MKTFDLCVWEGRGAPDGLVSTDRLLIILKQKGKKKQSDNEDPDY